MKKKINSRLIHIFLLAFALRSLWFLVILHKNPSGFMLYDSWSYWRIAENLTSYGIYSQDSKTLIPDSLRTPFYPFFIFLLKKFFFGFYGIIFAQLIISSVTCALCSHIAGHIFSNERAGIPAGIFLAIDLSSVFFANTLMTETIFTFLLLLQVYFLLSFFKNHKSSYLIFSGIFLGLTILCRPVAVYLPILFSMAILFAGTFFIQPIAHECKPIRPVFFKIRSSFLLLLISYTVISPWVFRNYLTFGYPMLSPVGKINLLYYSAASIRAKKENKKLFDVQNEYREAAIKDFNWAKTEEIVRFSDYCKKEAVKIIIENPLTCLKNQSISFAYFFIKPLRNYIDLQLGLVKKYNSVTSSGSPINAGNILGNTSFITLIFVIIQGFLLVLYAFFSFVHFIRKKERPASPIVFMILVIFYFALMSTFTEADARMRVPAMPFIAIIAGCGAFLFATQVQKTESNL